MAIPTVDFSQLLHGSPADKHAAARAIDLAFQQLGFVQLRNHGVPQDQVDACFAWSKRFFDLPAATKQLAPHPPGGAHHRGYSGLGVEKVSQNVFDARDLADLKNVPDVKESFESGNVDDALQPNIWPPEGAIPGFRGFMEAFFEECKDLIHHILRALALALSLPEEQLSATHAQSLFQLRLLHYPPVPASLLESGRKSRISAHSDFGTLTLLFQDAVGGLQIEDPKQPGSFNDVASVPGTVMVNVGDLMERWSNARWKSTVHRVVAPPDVAYEDEEQGRVCPARYSVPFFATADPETVIEALPGCWDEEGRPKRFEGITAWGYLQMRMAALYT